MAILDHFLDIPTLRVFGRWFNHKKPRLTLSYPPPLYEACASGIRFTPSFTPSSLPVLVPVPYLPESHFITTKTHVWLVLIGVLWHSILLSHSGSSTDGFGLLISGPQV